MKRKLIIVSAIVLVVLLCTAFTFFTPLLKGEQTVAIYVDNDDTSDSVATQLKSAARWPQRCGVSMLAALTRYDKNKHTGKYDLTPKQNAIDFFRALRGGHQSPVRLTLPCVRTMEDLASYVSHNLMLDSVAFMDIVRDSSRLTAFGVDTATVYCLFLPNTYEVYWNISLEKFMARMKKESDAFWNSDRTTKAKNANLNPQEVYTLASIVDEETANNAEKPDIAGMYINRLKAGMPLQADPTIKYAWHRFDLRRIYHALLSIDSPYNTYRNTGLPPGPIRIASIEGIEAVLNHSNHNYIYMCAKEDFSGTHNFARTYSEHLANAARYSKALNERGIK